MRTQLKQRGSQACPPGQVQCRFRPLSAVPLFRPPPSKPNATPLPALMRASDFRRREGLPPSSRETTTRLTSLNPSVLEDLRRFETAKAGAALDALEVLAAAVRHGRNLLLHVKLGEHVLPLTVFAVERVVHTPLPLPGLMQPPRPTWQVLNVEPARLVLPSPGVRPLPGAPVAPATAAQALAPAQQLAPLAPLLWELALHGSRSALLPEIAGPMAYRIAPGAELDHLGADATLAEAVLRLRRRTCNLRDIADGPGMNEERAARLLNGLYLQAALVLSRSHPAAVNDGWDGGQKH